MAYTTIDDPSAHFQTALWTGNDSDDSSTQTITNDGNSDLRPDWVWVKQRSHAAKHNLVDSTRGASIRLVSNNSDGEEDQGTNGGIIGFHSDGFNVGHRFYGTNDNGYTYVGWQWKANGGTTSTNNDGSTASTVQANTTAGFSIVTFSRSAGGTITVGHGLGKKPDWIIVKSRQTSNNWVVTHKSLGTEMQDYYMILNGTDASSNSNDIFGGEPTTSVFSTTNNVASNDNQVAYCFTEIKGYSKFGSYTGNGNADGAFVYTGFKPAWLMVKKSAGNARAWVIHDNTQDPINPTANRLDANTDEANQSSGHFDFLSNGFKCRSTEGATNQDTHTFVYMAFAEHPFVSSKGVPTTAR
jgi:hypothetical protein